MLGEWAALITSIVAALKCMVVQRLETASNFRSAPCHSIEKMILFDCMVRRYKRNASSALSWPQHWAKTTWYWRLTYAVSSIISGMIPAKTMACIAEVNTSHVCLTQLIAATQQARNLWHKIHNWHARIHNLPIQLSMHQDWFQSLVDDDMVVKTTSRQLRTLNVMETHFLQNKALRCKVKL